MTKNNESLPAVVEPQELMTTNRARAIAEELVGIVEELGWSKKFGGEKNHLEIDAWQFIAAKDGATASIVDIRELKNKDGDFIGFCASAALMKNGECLTEAQHECTTEEKNWRGKPRYALLGMAQTRAMSRVCRNRYSWIARMGGYSGTPADEMDAEFVGNNKGKEEPDLFSRSPQKKSSSAVDDYIKELEERAWKNMGELDKWWNEQSKAMLKLSEEDRKKVIKAYHDELAKFKK